MYVPTIVRDKLVRLDIRENEPFAICRAERREGNRQFNDWAVQRNGASQPPNGASIHGEARSLKCNRQRRRGEYERQP